jgi:steroid 5-alpha reductase family enzyme
MFMSATKRNSVLLIAAIYVSAFVIVYCIFPLLPDSRIMINLFIGDMIATVVIFIFSMVTGNSSVYDPYWSVVPPVIAVYLVTIFPGANRPRQLIILALVLFWSIRLTFNWLRGWQGLRHQDWRYTAISEKTGIGYWPVSFVGIHLMPTFLVFLGCFPLRYALSAAAPLNGYDIPAVLFTLSAILTEWIADEQLYRFRKGDGRGTFIQSGLWQYSRHPNYLGEVSFWGGIFLFVLSSSEFKIVAGYWTLIGLVCMVILFTRISIPLMEKRNRERKPGYAEYVKKVPALLPRLFHRRDP